MKTKRRSAGKRVKKHTKVSARKSVHGKKPTAAQKARAAYKAVKAKLAALKVEFKAKIKHITETTYHKALTDALHAYQKKAAARHKAIAAAEAKFEKKFAKKLGKKTKKTRRKKSKGHAVAAVAHHAPVKKRGRRRKSKK